MDMVVFQTYTLEFGLLKTKDKTSRDDANAVLERQLQPCRF